MSKVVSVVVIILIVVLVVVVVLPILARLARFHLKVVQILAITHGNDDCLAVQLTESKGNVEIIAL